MNPNHMFKQPVEVTEKQLKHPKVTVFVAFIAMHGLLQTWILIFCCLVNTISSSKLHFIKAVAYRGGVLEDVLGLEDVLEDRF